MAWKILVREKPVLSAVSSGVSENRGNPHPVISDRMKFIVVTLLRSAQDRCV
jgi:hypothetical protein